MEATAPESAATRRVVHALSVFVFVAVAVVLYAFPGRTAPHSPGVLPTINALLNGSAGVFLVLGFVFIELHRRLQPGRAWALIRRSEAAALASGVNVTLYKTWAFGLSGLLAGLGGGLLAGSLGLLDASTFRASESVLLFALVIVGGARSWLGIVLAAVLFRVAPGLLNNWGVDADLALVFFGAALLHAVITAPEGIAGQIIGLLSRLRRRNRGQA